MRAIHVLVAVAAMLLIAWAPSPGDLGAVKDSPEKFKGKELEITAPIAENSVPEGGEFRTWSFILDSCGKGGLVVEEKGFNPATIEKAYRLVEEARLKGDKVTVAGKLKSDPKAGLKMDVVWVRYGDTQVNTDEGPFVEEYYGDDIYPGSPIEYEGRLYYAGEFPKRKAEPTALAKEGQTQLARVPSGCDARK